MRMSMSLTPRVCHSMKCTMCDQYMHSDWQEDDMTDAALFGFVQYAICLNCKQKVPKEDWTRSYKCRWTRRWNRMKKDALEKLSKNS